MWPTLIVAAVLLLVLVWSLQRRLVYFPGDAVPLAPDDVEEVTLETADGLALAAWLIRPSGMDRGVSVIVFPGNAGNRSGRLGLGRRLAAEGLEVLLVDYRGYGGNPGAPSESGLLSDARAAMDFMADRGSQIVLFGESLGAAVGTALAVERPPAALALRSPFTSLSDVGRAHFWWVPPWFLRDRYPVAEQIGSVDVPVLVVLGSADSIVPPDLSEGVYEAASEPKLLAVIEDADHNDFALASGPRLIKAVDDFIRSHVGR